MSTIPPFVDIHCHLIPSIDDGARNESESIAMAEMAVADGIRTIIATPHQLGNYRHNTAIDIRERVAFLNELFVERGIDLAVLPGADVRIEEDLVDRIQNDQVMTLADHRRHVLLELPHESYFPLESLHRRLANLGMVGILSHPERNQGIQHDPAAVVPFVDAGGLLQVTAGSLVGTFGPTAQKISEWLFARGLVHFVSTDAHGAKARRPLMSRAFRRVVRLTDQGTAVAVCCTNPAAVARGDTVSTAPTRRSPKKRRLFASILGVR